MAARRKAGSSASRSRIGKAQPERIASEAAALRALLEQSLGGLGVRPVDVSDASALVRAFWEQLGWSPFFAASLEPPETAHAAATAKQLMQEYAHESHFKLRLRDLPKSYRVVHVDSQGLGFMLTDEASGDDPALLDVSEQASTITPARGSYLAHCAATLIDLAFSRIYRATLLPAGALDLGGERLLPLLAPDVRKLGEGVWLLSKQKTSAGSRIELAHASTAALIGWLRDLPDATALTLELLFAGNILDVGDGIENRLRDVRTLSNKKGDILYRIGTLADEPVVHWRNPKYGTADLLVSPRHRSKLAVAADVTLEQEYTLASWESLHNTVGLIAPPPSPRYEAADMERALEDLEALLCEFVPEHEQTRRSLELEPDAPRDVRALWRIVGESALTRRVVKSPDRATGEAVIERTLSRWMQDAVTRDRWQLGEGCDPRLGLPAKRRLAQADVLNKKYDYLVRHSSYLAVTDETDDSTDPPVLEFLPSRPEPRFLPTRYVAHVAKQLLGKAFNGAVGPATVPEATATLPFAPLLNDVWLVAPGVYCVSRASTVRAPSPYVARFRSLHAYYAYVVTLPDAVLVENAPQGADTVRCELPKAAKLTQEGAAAAGFRILPRPERKGYERQYAIGLVGKVPVWLEWGWLDDKVRDTVCITAKQDLEQVKVLLQALTPARKSR